MEIKTTKKSLLQRLFKTKDSKQISKTVNVDNITQKQNRYVTQIKPIANNVKHKPPRATVGTYDFISPLQPLAHMEKKRQKMTTPYIRSQSSDPTPSPLKTVQTVTQNMATLPPNIEELTQPTSSARGTVFDTPAPPVTEYAPGNLSLPQSHAAS